MAVVSGGTGVYQYKLENVVIDWQESPVFSSLTAGNYQVRVQDSNNN